MAATLPPPRLLPSGDSAITVEFSRNIDDVANRRVLALDRAMAAEPIAAREAVGWRTGRRADAGRRPRA